jgi:hypothetical protein
MTTADVGFVLDVRQDEVVAGTFERDLLRIRESKGPVLRAHFPYGGDGWIAVGHAEASKSSRTRGSPSGTRCWTTPA